MSRNARGLASVIDAADLHRQRGRILDLAQGKARLDRRNAVESRQLVLQESLIGGEIGGDHAQQIVAVSGHQIAFEHFVPFGDRAREAVEVLLLLPSELDRDEDADMETERFLVDGGDVAADHAALLEQLDAAMAGRDRQPDLVRQLLHRHAAVGLQQAEDLAVDSVEGRHWNELVNWSRRVGIYPKYPTDVARI
jgi:hypothetical protein